MHNFDEDCICIHCGFDGAEWHHWKHHTYEGRASEQREPECTYAQRSAHIKSEQIEEQNHVQCACAARNGRLRL